MEPQINVIPESNTSSPKAGLRQHQQRIDLVISKPPDSVQSQMSDTDAPSKADTLRE